jgi:hypothetical protein
LQQVVVVSSSRVSNDDVDVPSEIFARKLFETQKKNQKKKIEDYQLSNSIVDGTGASIQIHILDHDDAAAKVESDRFQGPLPPFTIQ